jgi:hypothetical protein
MVVFLGIGCIFGGFVMLLSRYGERSEALRVFNEKINPYKILIGLAVLIIGVIKFISPYHGGNTPWIPVFVDLIPSVLAMLSGLFVSVDFIESLKGVQGRFIEKLKDLLNTYQYPIGYAAVFFGIIHWILFKVLFL